MHSVKTALILLSLLTLTTPLWEGCSEPTQCSGDLGDATINPNQSKCTKHCECNNQRFEGYCIRGFCTSYQRDACTSPGKQGACVPQTQFASELPKACKIWGRTCQPPGLGKYWGNCHCMDKQQEASPEAAGDAGTTPEASQSEAPQDEASAPEQTRDRVAADKGGEKRCGPVKANAICALTSQCCSGQKCFKAIKSPVGGKRCSCQTHADCPRGQTCCTTHPLKATSEAFCVLAHACP